MDLPRVIGLAGAAGSGKSTLADYFISKHGYTRVKMAGPLKDMCRAIGLTDEQIEGDQKEQPTEMLCGRTPRYFMQHLGTDFGRDIIGQDIWTQIWKARAEKIINNGGRVICDDVRFVNEVNAILTCGGDLLMLVRDGESKIESAHASEHGLRACRLPIIENNGSIESLALCAESMLGTTDNSIDPDGWIRWRGNYLCPLALSQSVAVRYRDGSEHATKYACDLQWSHTGAHDDIVAYKMLS